jgi:hypothetical protein
VAQDLTQQGINNDAIMSVTGHCSKAGLRAYQQTSATQKQEIDSLLNPERRTLGLCPHEVAVL